MYSKSRALNASMSGTNLQLDEYSEDHVNSLVNKDDFDWNFKPSIHQNMISQYLENTKFESIMTAAMRDVFEGDLIPKNPYPKLIRALNTSNTLKEVLRNFNEKVKYVTKNVTEPEGAFGITTIQARPLFFGLKHLLEWVDVEKLMNLRKAILDFLPDYKDEIRGTRLVVSSSIGGGYLLHSRVLPYPDSAPSPLEINSEVFIESGDVQAGLEIFTNFVFDDIKSITNVQAYHIFRYFRVEFYDEQERQEKVKMWNIQDILAKQNQFLFDVQRATLQKRRFFMKIFLKIKRVNYKETEDLIRDRKLDKNKNPNYFQDSQFDKNFQFVDTTKFYNFHFIEKGKSQASYTFHPMRSLLRGVFLDELVAHKYAGFFYKENERYVSSKGFKLFIDTQLALILPKWKDQNLLYCSWEFFYIALTVENDELKRKLIDNLIQILSSEYAYLYASTRINKILVFLVIAYRLKTFSFYKFAANETFKIYFYVLAEILAKGGTAEIIVFREYLQKALNGIIDMETRGIEIHLDTNRILKTIYRITRAIAESNIQIASVYVKNLSDFMYQTFVKAQTLDPKDLSSTVTYENSLKLKVPKRVIHISAELKNARQGSQAEEELFLNYINEYEIFDYLFLTIQDMFFNPQVPNPIPIVSFKMEYQAYKFQLKEVPSERLKTLLNDPSEDQLLHFRNTEYPNIYKFANEFMHAQALPPIIGLKELILVTSVNECSSLKTYMDNLHWKKAITKGNPNYEIADIFSVNPLSMVSHASIVKRRYSEWALNYDFVMKGPSFDKAAEVFFDIFLRYAQWLENVEDIHVLGFYDSLDAPRPFLDINTVIQNFHTPEPRNFLRNYFANNRRVMLKFVSVVEGHFKVMLLFLNMHYLDASSSKPRSLVSNLALSDCVKLFFKPEDYVMWNKLFPFDYETTIKNLQEQIKYMKIIGKMNYGYKLEIIKAALEEDSRILLKLFRGLFGTSEPFYLAAKEGEALKCAFEVLEKIQNNEQIIKKLDLRSTADFFNDFKENLIKKVLIYHNYNLEGTHPRLLNLLTKVESIYKTKSNNYEYILEKLEKVILYCLSVGDTAYLSFEKSVFEKERLRNLK